MSDLSAFRALVTGKVTGVGFRLAAYRFASARGLQGWVRNLEDGRLEVVAQGPEHLLAELRQWLRSGPPGARVEDVEMAGLPWDHGRTGPFTIRG